MNLRSISVFGIMSIFCFHAALADSVECYPISGEVQIFPAEAGKCPLLKQNRERFSNYNFLFDYTNIGNPGGGLATCFSGLLSGAKIKVGGKKIALEGTSESALGHEVSAAAPPENTLSAVSAIRIRKPNILKGRLFYYDIIYLESEYSATGEYLDIRSGSRVYKKVTEDSEIQIIGDALAEKSHFEGKICL